VLIVSELIDHRLVCGPLCGQFTGDSTLNVMLKWRFLNVLREKLAVVWLEITSAKARG
jgi:hypothetical protein